MGAAVLQIVLLVLQLGCQGEHKKIAQTPTELRTDNELRRFLEGRWIFAESNSLEGLQFETDGAWVINSQGETKYKSSIEYLDQSRILHKSNDVVTVVLIDSPDTIRLIEPSHEGMFIRAAKGSELRPPAEN